MANQLVLSSQRPLGRGEPVDELSGGIRHIGGRAPEEERSNRLRKMTSRSKSQATQWHTGCTLEGVNPTEAVVKGGWFPLDLTNPGQEKCPSSSSHCFI